MSVRPATPASVAMSIEVLLTTLASVAMSIEVLLTTPLRWQ